jgi:thiamine biosynthesis lipoprotein
VIAGVCGLLALGALAIASRLPREAIPPVADAATAGSVVRRSRPLMGSMAELSVYASRGREAAAAQAISDALDLFAALEKRVSAWEPTSETSAVNRAAGSGLFTRVSPDLRDLVAASIEWAKRTNGAFDVTGGPLFELWDAARKAGEPPGEDAIRAARSLVGYSRIELLGDLLRLEKPLMKLGFGGIGEGFAADRAAALLRERGFRDFIVDASGDLVLSGSRGGEPWDVAIRHPRKDEFIAMTRATDCAIATSGDYERFVMTKGGERLSHILDLRTGFPSHGAASVTVFARSATDADALATALAAMGVERGLEFVAHRPGVDAFFVAEGGVTRSSAGLSFDGERLSWTR